MSIGKTEDAPSLLFYEKRTYIEHLQALHERVRCVCVCAVCGANRIKLTPYETRDTTTSHQQQQKIYETNKNADISLFIMYRGSVQHWRRLRDGRVRFTGRLLCHWSGQILSSKNVVVNKNGSSSTFTIGYVQCAYSTVGYVYSYIWIVGYARAARYTQNRKKFISLWLFFSISFLSRLLHITQLCMSGDRCCWLPLFNFCSVSPTAADGRRSAGFCCYNFLFLFIILSCAMSHVPWTLRCCVYNVQINLNRNEMMTTFTCTYY